MENFKNLSRRKFISTAAKTVGIAAAGSAVHAFSPGRALGANDRLVIAVIGIRGRGQYHYQEWTKHKNVEVKTLCDIDENLFQDRVTELEKLQGKKPKTEFDLRRVFDDKDIDAVSIAACDHWHALATIWACQAGKHVYVEKPTSHNIWEGRKMVEASRKYNRVVCAGMQNRSIANVREAMKFLHEGGIGEVYMARALCYKPRDTIGFMQDAPIPEGVHYDIWLGPAPYRPFNPNRFHYNWHWYWDYGMPDIGNQGPHQMDIARWGLNKYEHPKKIKSVGGYFAFRSQQETPNTQIALFEYGDGKIVQFETRGCYTNDENGIQIGNLFYGSEGWMHLNGDKWATYLGRKNEPGPHSDDSRASDASDPMNLRGSGGSGNFTNFIETCRSGNFMELNADILDGHKSTVMCHLANISYRVGRELTFDDHNERFVDDDQANGYITRNYRYPYIVPEKV